jgi:hypothetical protein
MKRIKVDHKLTKCPICGAELNYGSLNTKIATTCHSCNYYEKAGSLHILTFMSKVVSEYCTLNNITSWKFKDQIVDIEDGMSARALLPLLTMRSNELSTQNQALAPLSTSEPFFHCVKDTSSWLGVRTTINSNITYSNRDEVLFLISQEIIKITSVVTESLDMAKTLNYPLNVLDASTILINNIPSTEQHPTQTISKENNLTEGMEPL